MVVIALVDATFLVGNEVIEVFIFPMLSIAWGRLTKYSQDGLDEAYSPPQFKLADKYAYIIKHVAICLTFGSACPLLYCICFVALAMMYVCQKAALVMYYARPSVTEDSLAEAFRDQLTILLFMHVTFSRTRHTPSMRTARCHPPCFLRPLTGTSRSRSYSTRSRSLTSTGSAPTDTRRSRSARRPSASPSSRPSRTT